MLYKMSDYAYQKINWKIFLIATIIFMFFVIVVLPQVSSESYQVTGSEQAPDTKLWYNVEQLYEIADDYGEEGRTWYIKSRLHFDVIWPLAYGLFLLCGITIVLAHYYPNNKMRIINLLPLLAVILDFCENITVSIVMYFYPSKLIIAQLAPFFTLSKWLAVFASFIILGLFSLIKIEGAIKKQDKLYIRVVFRVLLLFAVLLIMLIMLVVSYFSDYYKPLPEALDSLQSTQMVDIYESGNMLVFEPKQEYQRGFIFYPGGKVDELAYAPLLKEISERGILVVLVKMPARLAIFGINSADQVIAEFPEVDNWSLGGHSLGGAMSIFYLDKNPQAVDKLILWASYTDRDISNADYQVLSIYGNNDGLIPVDVISETEPWMPQNTKWVEIAGGNHAQFGMYGEQDQDLPADISISEQHRIIVESTIDFILDN